MPQRIYGKSALALIIIGCFGAPVWRTARPAFADAPSAGAPGDTWQTVAVEKTFNNVPFDYQIKFRSQRNGYRVYEIKFPSPVKTALERNNTVPADYYLPNGITPGDARRPAVICLHILDGNDALTDMVCSVLALRGVPAIMFRLPYYGERGLPGGPEVLAKDPKMFAGAIAQAGEDLRRTIDVLASRPEVDADRIGVTGISLGGIIAATAAGGEPRINRAAFFLAGGDLMKIIHHARETRPLSKMILALPPQERGDIEGKIAEVDPLRFAAGLKEKARQGKVMMINAAEDEVIPKTCTEKLAAAMEMSDRVEWIQGLGHYTSMAELPRVLKSTADFFAQDLPPGTAPPVVGKQSTPFQTIAGVLGQAAAILGDKPKPGKCHIVDLEVTIARMDQQQEAGHFRLVRGTQGKFAFSCKLPGGTEISIGQSDHPWMATGGKEVYDGTKDPVPALKDPLEFFDAKQVALLRMLCGVLNSVALAPDVLERLIAAKFENTIDGDRVIQMSLQGKIPTSIKLELKSEDDLGLSQISRRYARMIGDSENVPLGKPEECTPQTLTFNFPGVEGSVKFADWKINAPEKDSLFQPPANLPRRKVDQSFLYTLFSTSLKFALGTVE
ncbi:MAG: dienelactone hydrolase family protein [Thermoguttaceae bacterium]|jgi:dienelactone hydrolase